MENKTNETGLTGKMIKRGKKLPKLRKLQWIRNLVQFLCLLVAPALFSQAFGGVKEAFGAIGQGIPLSISSFTVRLGMLCLLTVVAGRVFCGWMCVFGALGDWVYQFFAWLQKKYKRKLPRLSERLVAPLQKVKYVVLAGILLLCFVGQTQFVTAYSPWTVFSMMTAGQFRIWAYPVGAGLLVLILIGMAFHERFFCQFLCPMGAIFSLLPELPLLSFKKEKQQCIPNCQACKRQCPVSLEAAQEPVRDGECIRCGRCMAVCPKKNIHILSRRKC